MSQLKNGSSKCKIVAKPTTMSPTSSYLTNSHLAYYGSRIATSIVNRTDYRKAIELYLIKQDILP